MTHPFPEPLPSDLTTDSIAAASSAAGTRSQARWTGDISGRDSEGGGDGHHLIGAGAGDLRRRSGGRCREEEIGQLAGHLLGVHRLAAASTHVDPQPNSPGPSGLAWKTSVLGKHVSVRLDPG